MGTVKYVLPPPFLLRDRVSLSSLSTSPDCPRTHSEDYKDPPTSASECWDESHMPPPPGLVCAFYVHGPGFNALHGYFNSQLSLGPENDLSESSLISLYWSVPKPKDPTVPASPTLRLQEYAAIPDFFRWVLGGPGAKCRPSGPEL